MKGKSSSGSYFVMILLLVITAYYIFQHQGINSLIDMIINAIFVSMFVAVVVKGFILGKGK